MEITPNEKFIKDNLDKTIHLIGLTNDLKSLKNLLEHYEERYALCPASSRKGYFSYFPGGLMFHNLRVLNWLNNFSSLMMPKEISKESLIRMAILHDIGKLGIEDKEYYILAKEEWKRKKGIYFEINPELQFMKIAHRSIYLAQQWGIKLTEEEYLAVLLHEGQMNEANASYKYKEPKLALLLQHAIQWSIKLERENIVHWPE